MTWNPIPGLTARIKHAKIAAARLDDEEGTAETLRSRELSTRRSRQSHEIAVSGLEDEAAAIAWTRKEQRLDAREASALRALLRRATVTGTRHRITHRLKNSGELRALRLQRTRMVSLLVLLPVLLAFAAWSTIGVHTGAVGLLDAAPGTGAWWAAWALEPAMITVVAGIIIVQAVIRSSGGDLDWRAEAIKWGALLISIILNLSGAWPDSGTTAAIAATVLHSLGPIACALTAVLVSVIDDAVQKARPFEGVESVTQLDEASIATQLDSMTRLNLNDPTRRLTGLDSSEPTQVLDSTRPESVAYEPTHSLADSYEPTQLIFDSLTQPEPTQEGIDSVHAEAVRITKSAQPARVKSTRPRIDSAEIADRAKIVIEKFEELRAANQPHTHSIVARETGVPKATVTRYLAKHLKTVNGDAE